MGPTIKRLAFIVLSVILVFYSNQCITVSEEPAKTPSSPSRYEVKPVKTWTDPKTSMEFVWVPGGCYEMGCGPWTKDCLKQELPVHEVCVDGFWLGKYEVTQGQWKQLMRSNNSRFNMGDLYPVENVTWDETQKFIKALNDQQDDRYQFRLPTEAEWEYAARSGGKPEMFAGGNDAKTVAWYQTNSRQSTHLVGQKAPNGLGIYDMSGNVWEWCQDFYGTGSYGRHTKNNPVILDNASTRRVIRGGGFNSYARLVRCSQRWEQMPGVRDSNIGFRIAMDQR